jgi:hypothetical protein
MFDYFELTKGVFVFKNVLKDPKHTYNVIKNSQQNKHELFTDWMDWGISGYKSTLDMYEKRNLDNEPGAVIKELRKVHEECFRTYKDKHLNMDYLRSLDIDPYYDIPLTEEEMSGKNGWGSADILLVDYSDSFGDDGFINGYHVDRAPYWGSQPHAFTLNVYPYDKFDGGGLSFINEDTAVKKFTDNGIEYYEIDEPIHYEPEAGDAMLFSSLHYHGVYGTKNGEKLFIRMYMEAPWPNQYKEELKSMTQDQIQQKIADARKECFATYAHQGNVYNSIEEIKAVNNKSRKFIVR